MSSKRIAKVPSFLGRAAMAAVALGLGFGASPASAAAVLVTPPYMGGNVNTGYAQCVATNLGPVAAYATITMFNAGGTAIAGPSEVYIPPKSTLGLPEVNLAFDSPTTCTFAIGNKKLWRASMFVVPLLTGSGTDAVVVPAQ